MGASSHKKAPRRRGSPRRTPPRRQVNIRIEASLYRLLEASARVERRSVSQTAMQLIESGLRQDLQSRIAIDDTPAQEIAMLAVAGKAFDWLANEPDLYDDTSGEPL